MRRALLFVAVLIIPACGKSKSGFVPTAATPTKPVAIAGENFKALEGVGNNYFTTAFDTATGWTLSAPVGGVGWSVDATPVAAPGGAFRSAANSLNYNNGTDYNSGGSNSGTATSPSLNISGIGSAALVFWCNYDTEVVDGSNDKRRIQVSNDSFVTKKIDQTFTSTAAAPYQCSATGVWHRHIIPLDGTWGIIQVRFLFDRTGALGTAHTGWFLDDLAVRLRLNGLPSNDPAGGPVSYLWEQTAGTPVALSDPTAAETLFDAPPSGNVSFRLTVTGAEGTNTATVTATIKPFLVSAPDTWFVGYGSAGTITAVVSGTTSAPTSVWSGLEPWLTVTGLTSLALGYTAPTLVEFQNLPDRAGVLLMQRTTQGRLQLKIAVSDGAVTDEDYVNFSVGPFADSVANENAALGEPVFLNGAGTIPKTSPVTITTWTWTGIKPNGSAVAFKKPNKANLASTDQRFVYFVPDLVGTYTITVDQNNGTPDETIKTFEIVCGKYVGIGNLTGSVPNPFIGECASCHAGQLPWLADFANPWKSTAHAHALETILDPVNPLFTPSQAKNVWVDFFNFGSDYSIDSRSVGWSRPGATSNGGWADMATAEGCVLRGSSWDDVVRKHPKTAGKSNVQCESCHGPGSEHAGDSAMIRKSYDALVCGRCHSSKQDLWESSGHGQTSSPAFNSGSGSTSCNSCHTAQGYVVEMRAQEGADPHPALFAVANIARPVLPLDDRRSVTCQACHEPHKKTVGRPAQPGPDPQLRAYGNVKFRNDAVAFGGEAATCYTCHQSRTDTRVNSPDWNVRRAPHDSTAAEMLSATNAFQFPGWTYNSSPHADKTRFIVPGKSEARQCLTCHNDVTPAKGQLGYQAMGGHSFKMAQGDDTDVLTTAAGAGATVAGTRKFTFSPASPVSSFLRKVYAGDELTLTGTDAGTYVIDSVDGARQITLQGGGAFTGGAPTTWSIKSVAKYNVAACTQCHTTAADFRDVARGNYDGSGGAQPVQDEIAGLLAALKSAIDTKLGTLVGSPATFSVASGRVKYTITAGSLVRTFPGPGVPTSDNPDIAYAGLSAADKASWDTLYAAAYNWVFVTNDHSEGIHNTGYAVNLLQSAYKAVTGTTLAGSAPFVPF